MELQASLYPTQAFDRSMLGFSGLAQEGHRRLFGDAGYAVVQLDISQDGAHGL